MALIDFILNVAGLLLWINWRTARLDPMALSRPSTLAGTLRRAEKPRVKRWHFLVVLAALILLRAVIYRLIGPAADWTATLKVTPILVSFRSDHFWRMLLYSALSFGVIFASFLLCMLFLSVLARSGDELDGVRKFARVHIGFVEDWPWWLKLLLPLLAITIAWWVLSWPLGYWKILSRPVSSLRRLEQAVVIGFGSYLVWKYIIAAVLTLHVLNSYIYLGNHPLWGHVTVLARRILTPLRFVPLRVGKLDLAPVVTIAAVLLIAGFLDKGTPLPRGWRLCGLVDVFQSVSR